MKAAEEATSPGRRRGRPPGTGKGTARRPDIDALLTGEYSMEEIARSIKPISHSSVREHITRQRVCQYLSETRQYEAYLEKRKQFLEQAKAEREAVYQRLAHILLQHVYKMAQEESRALQKALEYYFSRRNCGPLNVPLDKIINLLEIYKTAKDSGERLSLGMLAEKSGIRGATNVGAILKRAGLQPLFGSRERHPVPKGKKDAIYRSYTTNMPASAIGYFLGLPAHIVRQNMRRHFGDAGTRKKFVMLTYADASQIYQAQDCGWSEKEIAYCFNGKQKMVRYALGQRHDIEPRIINLLDVLYPDVRHDKPYLGCAA